MIKCFSDGEPTPSVYWRYPVNGKGKVIEGVNLFVPTLQILKVLMNNNQSIKQPIDRSIDRSIDQSIHVTSNELRVRSKYLRVKVL